MVPHMVEGKRETSHLLERAAAGDARAWGALLTEHEGRLLRMAAFRLDPRLRGRVEAADVVQEAYADASARGEDYFRQGGVPLFLWLRGVVANKLLELHRRHLGTHMRDAGREVARHGGAAPDTTSAAMVEQLTGHATRPSQAAAWAETSARLRDALESMDATDRDVLALRHFEQLSNAEAALVLGIQERAAAKRYLRALQRLKSVLAEMPGGLTELRP